MKSRGFTLLEMLVAVAIFAVLALMGYGGLNSVLLTQSTVASHADELGRLQQTYIWLQRDLEQVVPRPIRDELGDPKPAMLAGSQYGAMLELTRGGWRNPLGQPRSDMMRVAYRIVDDKLIRQQWLVLDRAQDSKPIEKELLTGVKSIEVRLLDQRHDWQPQWPPANVQGDPGLPRGAEVILDTTAWGELRWLFRLPG